MMIPISKSRFFHMVESGHGPHYIHYHDHTENVVLTRQINARSSFMRLIHNYSALLKQTRSNFQSSYSKIPKHILSRNNVFIILYKLDKMQIITSIKLYLAHCKARIYSPLSFRAQTWLFQRRARS